MYIKAHYGKAILAKMQKIEKTLTMYLSYANQLQFSLHCHHNKGSMMGQASLEMQRH